MFAVTECVWSVRLPIAYIAVCFRLSAMLSKWSSAIQIIRSTPSVYEHFVLLIGGTRLPRSHETTHFVQAKLPHGGVPCELERLAEGHRAPGSQATCGNRPFRAADKTAVVTAPLFVATLAVLKSAACRIDNIEACPAPVSSDYSLSRKTGDLTPTD